jgi:poly(3-hydroxybutyrate) depolymerase
MRICVYVHACAAALDISGFSRYRAPSSHDSLMFRCFFAAVVSIVLYPFDSVAEEMVLTDSEGKPAYLYAPSAEPQPGKRYWLVVGAHGNRQTGKGACGIAAWAKDDVLVLGPSFASPGDSASGENVIPYQMAGPTHEAKLIALVREVGKRWNLHPRFFLHGFSAGAQFAHRFAMKNPSLVLGVSAGSAGSWSTRGYGAINPAARHIPFVISCGELDVAKSTPDSPLSRLEWMQEFATALRAAEFDVDARVIPGVGHKQTQEVIERAAACFARARGITAAP